MRLFNKIQIVLYNTNILYCYLVNSFKKSNNKTIIFFILTSTACKSHEVKKSPKYQSHIRDFWEKIKTIQCPNRNQNSVTILHGNMHVIIVEIITQENDLTDLLMGMCSWAFRSTSDHKADAICTSMRLDTDQLCIAIRVVLS